MPINFAEIARVIQLQKNVASRLHAVEKSASNVWHVGFYQDLSLISINFRASKRDSCRISTHGLDLFKAFLAERIYIVIKFVAMVIKDTRIPYFKTKEQSL